MLLLHVFAHDIAMPMLMAATITAAEMPPRRYAIIT